MSERSKKVLVGMSGGVDSSAAALVLLRQGYEVTGLTLLLQPFSEGHGSSQDVEDARRVAQCLGIPHRTLDLSSVFQKTVVDRFVRDYEAGRTPNPCVVCNRHIKFGAMLEYALQNGFDFVATGHYVRIRRQESRWLLYRADSPKDQSYMLYSLRQEQLSRILAPLEGKTKQEVRSLAEEAGLPVAQKPDSQEICFVPDNDYSRFLETYTGRKPEPGYFVDASGTVLGRHRGITQYTIGQRKGLGIALGRPMYVTHMDSLRNEVTLGPEGSQYRSSLLAGELNWIPFEQPEQPFRCEARIRYHASAAPCLVTPLPSGEARVLFDAPQRSVTPGQAVVFYEGDLVLGGGTILQGL